MLYLTRQNGIPSSWSDTRYNHYLTNYVYQTIVFPLYSKLIYPLLGCKPKEIEKSKLYDASYADVTWFESFNGVRRALRFLDTPSSIVREYARWVEIDDTWLQHLGNMTIRIVLPFFKKLKSTIHDKIDFLPAQCRYFIDIETIAGYPKMQNRQFTDDPKEWLSSPSQSNYDTKWWTNAFIETYGNAITRQPLNLLSLREFTLCRWLWVTDGATRFSKLMLEDEIIKTKLGAAVTLSDAELLNHVFNINKNHRSIKSKIGVFIKPDEKGYKRRLIANLPLGAYIIAAYMRYLIVSFTGDEPNFMKLSPTPKDMIDVIELLKTKSYAMPLDESSYDYNVTNESWHGFINFMKYTFPENEAILLFEGYFEHAIWDYDGKKGVWNSGMPSGLALTSFVNSWMNYIKQKTVVNSTFHWAAGDDTLTFPADQELSLDYVGQEYKKFGSVAHPLKNWTSYHYAEYLKRFYTMYGTTAYPARVYSSLIWAGTERFYLPSDRLPELAELFKQFFDRLGKHMDEDYVAADLCRSVSNKVSGFTKQIAKQWLHSPRIHGGFGKLPYCDKAFTWHVEQTRRYKYRNNLIRLPDVTKHFGKVDLKITTFKFNPTISFKTGPRYNLPPILTLDDWERRLNREDFNIRGPFASLAIENVPLPTIDFISTDIMSQLAQQGRYNVYPNLHGNWNSIANRCIVASYALVSNAVNLMRTYKVSSLI